MIELASQLSKRPFDPSRSPWEVFLIPKFQSGNKKDETKSAVIMRFHHCMLDGICVSKTCERLGETPWKTSLSVSAASPIKFRSKQVGVWQATILPKLRLLVEGPYEILRAFYFSGENHPWLHKAMKEKTGNISNQISDIISLETLRIICTRSKGEFTVSSLLLAIFLQAAAKAMKRQNIIPGNSSKIYIATPWPLPNHPAEASNGLCNHWTVVKFGVVVDTNDLSKTVRNVSREYKKLTFSVLSHAFAALTNLVGSLPISWIEKSDGGLTSTCLLSSFPCPFHVVGICGVEVEDWITGGSADACGNGSS